MSSVLFFLTAVLASCSGFRIESPELFEDAILLGEVKRSEPDVGGMWFGPRLGRRERRSTDEAPDDGDKVEELLEILKETPWALIPLTGMKQQDDADYLEVRSPPFAPRLGRRLVPFRPRLGRDHLPHDVYSPRLGRSTHPPPKH